MPAIYKIIYPNGKIYIGSDMTDDLFYFGSGTNEKIKEDFNYKNDFFITRKILYYVEDCTRSELVKKEMEYIKKYEANNPEKGYNLIPKYIE